MFPDGELIYNLNKDVKNNIKVNEWLMFAKVLAMTKSVLSKLSLLLMFNSRQCFRVMLCLSWKINTL